MVRLGDVCEIQSGGTPSRSKTEYWKDGTIPWVKIGDFSGKYLDKTTEHITQQGLDNSSAKLFSKGTILYSIFATLGEATILNIDATTNQAIAGIKIKDKSSVDIDYFYSFLKSLKDEVNRIGRGVAQNNINLSILKSFFIPLPPLETQKQIAAQLDKCTAVIAKHKQMLEKYDTLIKSRFIEMFGEIDISPQRNYWTELKDITTIYTGTTPSTTDEENWNGDILWITPAEMTSESFYIYNTERKITEKGQKSKSLSLMPANTVLLSTRAPIGKVGIAGSPMTCNQGFKNFYCKEDVLNPVYLYFLLKSNTEYLNSKGTGTTFKELSKSAAEKIKVPIPDFELQERFAAFVQQIDKSKFEIANSLKRLYNKWMLS